MAIQGNPIKLDQFCFRFFPGRDLSKPIGRARRDIKAGETIEITIMGNIWQSDAIEFGDFSKEALNHDA